MKTLLCFCGLLLLFGATVSPKKAIPERPHFQSLEQIDSLDQVMQRLELNTRKLVKTH